MKLRFLLNKVKQNYQRQDSKDYIETGIQAFKLLFYASITFGIIWNLAYFGIVVKILPDFGPYNLIGYLISIFGVGLCYIILIALIFVLPGLIFNCMQGIQTVKPKENQEIKKSPLLHIYLITACAITSLILIGQKLQELYAFAGLIAIILAFVFLIFKRSREFNVGSFIKEKVLKILDEEKIVTNLFRSTKNIKLDYKFIFGASLSILSFILTILFFLTLAESVRGSTKDTSYALFAFFMAILFASFFNGLIAKEGLDFSKTTKSRNLNYLISFSLICLILIFILSIYFNFAKQLLALPYNAVKLGSYNTNITLDNGYIKKSRFLGLDGNADSQLKNLVETQNRFCFKVLSSIGTEYIVKPLPDEECKPKSPDKPQDIKNKTGQIETYNAKQQELPVTHKTDYERILRIPKDKVLLVEYIERKKDK